MRRVKVVVCFERAKLRLLNSSHSALAYLGLLAGHEYVHEAISDPLLGRFIQKLMTEEIAPTVDYPQGFDIDTYQRNIVGRFANHAILYRTAQVAMDGSKKLPERLLNTLRDQLRASTPRVSNRIGPRTYHTNSTRVSSQVLTISPAQHSVIVTKPR